jgi:V/A-type H+-transporting ATPase subunit K
VVNELDHQRHFKRIVTISCVVGAVVVLSIFAVSATRAQVEQAHAAAPGNTAPMGWAFLGASLAAGFGCVGAGIAVGYVGAAAVGAVGEKPEVAGRTLIFVGLAEGIAIYGLIIAIMILGKV